MEHRLPPAFLERLSRIVPADRLDQVLRSFSEPQVTAFRVNTLLAATNDVVAALTSEGLEVRPVAWYADAFTVESHQRPRLMESTAYRENHLYVQNLSSMVPPLVLAPEPGDTVLDLTAAPGSKTLQMACLMNDQGEIAAVELVKGRFFRLKDNVRQHGATCVRTFLRNGETVWKVRPEHFDRVLLDAPCSTEGRFREDEPETSAYWSPRKVQEMVRKQRRLIFSAVQSLAVDGVLVYSTCSFAPEENEGIVQFVLDKFGDHVNVEPVEIDAGIRQRGLAGWKGDRFSPAVRGAARILPDRFMEGFFIAKFRKTGSTLGPQ
jgi:NOL1/NOP2/sun family putative RNA methylase